MRDEGASSTPPEAPRPLWKNPFVIAFVLGVVVLTALPLLQRRFLSAPPPLRTLAPWQLPTLTGGSVGSDALQGKVWLALFVPAPCDDPCHARVEAFGRARTHVDDLGEAIELVTYVMPNAAAKVRDLAGAKGWTFAAGDEAQLGVVLGDFRAGWDGWAHTDAGSSTEEFSRFPGIALVDQRGQLRGFWRDDVAGRGNAINAARLLAKSGPIP